MRAEVAHTEGKERETSPLGSEVHTHRKRGTIPSPFTKIHLVVVIDLAIMVNVHILDVAGPYRTAKTALVGRGCNLGFALEEARTLITPNAINSLSLSVLIGFNIILVNLCRLRIIIGAGKAE